MRQDVAQLLTNSDLTIAAHIARATLFICICG
jgi:hypothetical protein